MYIAKVVAFFSFSFATLLVHWAHMAIIFKAYIFGFVSFRALELLMQVLLAIEVSSGENSVVRLHVRSAIDRFSQSSIYLLVNLMEQSLIYK